MLRKAWVGTQSALGQLGLYYADSGAGGKTIARPFLGGVSSGFHSAPQQGDQVIVLHEGLDSNGGSHWYPAGAISVTDQQPRAALPSLNPGESGIYHTDGRVACRLLNNGTTQVFVDHNGVVTITIDSSSNVTLGTNNGSQTVKITNPLTLTNQSVSGSTNAPVVGGGGGNVNFPHTLNISVNGTSYTIPSLS